MVYTDGLYQPPIVELAKAGNFQAIAHWINQYLMPYGMRASVGVARPGCLKILVELPWIESGELPEERRDYLVRYICHRIWQLNSAVIEGAQIAAQFAGDPQILWEQSIRVVSPARRSRQQQSQQLRTQVQQTSQQKAQLKTFRALLVSGVPVFAFLFGCILGFSKAPVEQTNAVASSQPKTNSPQPEATGSQAPARSDTVRAALETVPVIKHDKVADPNDPTVTLMFSGDVTLAESFEEAIGKDYEHAFTGMNEYRQADLAMVNLENPLTKATTPLPDKQFNFKADPESVKVLENGGVDLVTLANNHTMDYEDAGLNETIDTLDKAGILHIGAGRDEKEARRPDIVEVKGQRVAYLGYYGSDFQSAGDKKAGTNYADEARIAADIKSIRDQVDWIVVNFHWGEEMANYPADWQVNLAHFTIDQGADLVVGHHPHVLQGAEIYKGRPIAYSLGNFIFGGNSRKDYDTAVLKVALKDKQMKVEFLPVEVRNYQPQVVKGDRGTQILHQIDDLSSSFGQPMRSPVVLDARLSPKTEPTTTKSSASPTESPAPFIEQPKAPTDSASPSPVPTASPSPESIAPNGTSAPSTEPTPSANTATPSPQPTTSPSDTATPAQGSQTPHEGSVPSTEATPSANTPTPSSQPNFPSDSAVPHHESQTPHEGGVPASEPSSSNGAASPSDSTIPPDAASSPTDSTLSEGSADAQSPSATATGSSSPSSPSSRSSNAISPNAQYSDSADSEQADSRPSHSDETNISDNISDTSENKSNSGGSSESKLNSDGSTDTADSLTDPAEADRLLREAEKLLKEDAPSASETAPPSAVGGPADPVEPSASAPESSATTDSTSSAPIDFSQPPDTSANSSHQPSAQSDNHGSSSTAEDAYSVPPAEPSPEAAPSSAAEPAPNAPVDTSFALPNRQLAPDSIEAQSQEAEKVALSYLGNSRKSAPIFGQYSEVSWVAPRQADSHLPAPAVALMAAAIW